LQESLACNPFPDSFKSFPCRTFQATTQCAAANILELNIDEFLRITTVENIQDMSMQLVPLTGSQSYN